MRDSMYDYADEDDDAERYAAHVADDYGDADEDEDEDDEDAEPVTGACSICPADAVAARSDGIHVHRACVKHARYLAGWIQDAQHERHCEEQESRRNDHQRDE